MLDGYRESEQSWTRVAAGPEAARARNWLRRSPSVTVLWASGRRSARCSPKRVSSAAGSTRRPTFSTRCPRACSRKRRATCTKSGRPRRRRMPNKAFDHFLEKYECEVLSRRASACKKDREVLLTFYDFPAEHWSHLRTTNPIESTFATIRLRHRKTKGSGTRRASLAMMFKLAQSASKKWRRLELPRKDHPRHRRTFLQRRNHAG